MPTRAKLPPGEGKRAPLNMRTTQKTRERLEKAAADSGRSLVQEVEFILERAFLVDDHLALVFDDAPTASFVREMLEAKRLIEAYQENSVWDDLECHEAMKAALVRLITQRAPRPSSKLKRKLDAYDRYKDKEEKPWKERGGGAGLFGIGNPDAGPPPKLKPAPLDLARMIGRSAADEVRKDRINPLAEALRKGAAQED
jgi:uncharacterized protein (DUF1778 family)